MWGSTALFPISLVLICVLFNGSIKQKLDNPYVIGWLSATFYFIHQTEEHGYDFRGWRYAFVPGFNHKIGPILFPECGKFVTCPLDPPVATVINVVAIWIGFSVTMVLAHYLGPEYAYAGYFNWGMAVVNAFTGHLLPWVFSGYNAGAVQSIFMFVFGMWAISKGGFKFTAACLANGLLFHAFCFGVCLKLLYYLQLPNRLDAVPCFIFTTAVPLLFAKNFPPDKGSSASDAGDADKAV